MKRQSGEKDRYVLDSSALFTLFEDEDGAETVQNMLEKAAKRDAMIFSSFVCYTEIFYITWQEAGAEEAQRRLDLISKLAITRVDSSQELGLVAGRLKANYRISFADAWVAATAIILGAILVHKDPEFEELEGELEMLRLPCKKG